MLNEAIIDTMVRQAMDITRNAYVRHESSLAVGACVLASDGTLYSCCTASAMTALLTAWRL